MPQRRYGLVTVGVTVGVTLNVTAVHHADPSRPVTPFHQGRDHSHRRTAGMPYPPSEVTSPEDRSRALTAVSPLCHHCHRGVITVSPDSVRDVRRSGAGLVRRRHYWCSDWCSGSCPLAVAKPSAVSSDRTVDNETERDGCQRISQRTDGDAQT